MKMPSNNARSGEESRPRSTKIITICSGKGGTGKSLISANLSYLFFRHNLNVLLIDLDFHVRGLTYLLFEKIEETYLSEERLAGVFTNLFTFLYTGFAPNYFEKFDVDKDMIILFKQFLDINRRTVLEDNNTKIDIMPCFFKKGEAVDWKLMAQRDTYSVWKHLKFLVDELEKCHDYDIIFLDTRAGPDALSFAACLVSDVALIVTEQDAISKRSSFNFLVQLKATINEYQHEYLDFITTVSEYFILNKATLPGYTQKEAFFGTIVLPTIRFNKRIYNEYGKQQFLIKHAKKTNFEGSLVSIIESLEPELKLGVKEAPFGKITLHNIKKSFFDLTRDISFILSNMSVIISIVSIIFFAGIALNYSFLLKFFRIPLAPKKIVLEQDKFNLKPNKFIVGRPYDIIITSKEDLASEDLRIKLPKLIYGGFSVEIQRVAVINKRSILLRIIVPEDVPEGSYNTTLIIEPKVFFGEKVRILSSLL